MTDQDNFKSTLDQFYTYLSGILELYRNAVPVLKEELDAIMDDSVEVLDQSLKSQQALLLQTKNFEQQTANYLSKLNIKAVNLTEMTQQLSEAEKFRFFNLIGEFELVMTKVNYYKDKCHTLLQSKLYIIDKALAGQDQQRDNTTYNRDASEVHGALLPKTFEKKI